MAKEIKPSFGLKSIDDIFSTQEMRDDEKLTKIREVPIAEIDDFPEHPFKVKDDEDMVNLVESIKEHGVLTPATIRKKEDGRYEMLSGHRRKRACELAGLDTIRCEVVEMDRDSACIFMVDSNLQRTEILPSEKAFSYKMRLDAMSRQGKRTDLTSCPVGEKLTSAQELGNEVADSARQIHRYIRLTELIPEILEMVDDKKIALRPAVEISYLPKEAQANLIEAMAMTDCTPSHAQTIRMRRMNESGMLSMESIYAIMDEEKPNQREKVVLKEEQLRGLIPKSVDITKRNDFIINALKFYKRHLDRQKDQER